MNKTDKVIEAVRRLDGLEARRQKITEGIDREIADVRREIAELTGESKPQGKPKGRQSKVGSAAVEVLRADPHADSRKLAVALYGSDSEQNRHKARAQIFNLKRAERIKPLPGGGWGVSERVANGRDQGAAMH